MKDGNGQLLSAYDLLKGLAGRWSTLDSNTQKYIATTIANTTQLNNFLALMNNFDHAMSATETALDSAGSAAQENSRYMESLEAKLSGVQASFQELSTSVVNSSLVKAFLDLANAALKLANTPIGTFVTQTLLLTGVLWGGKGLIEAMKVLPAFFAKVASGAGTAGAALSLTAPQIMLIAAGISLLISILPKAIDWFKEFTGNVEFLTEKTKEANTQLETNKQRLKDLQTIPLSSRTEEIEHEIRALEAENEQLERNIELYKQKVNKSQLKDIRSNKWVEGEATGNFTINWIESGNELAIQSVQSAEEAIEKLKALGYEYEGTGDKLEDFGVELKSINKSLLVTSDDYLERLIIKTKETVSSFDEVASGTEKEKQAFIDTYEQIQNYASTLKTAKENGEKLSASELELIEYAASLSDQYGGLLNKMYPVEDSMQRLAEGASITKNEFTNLINVYPDLIDALEETDGLYKINKDSLYNLAKQGNETARSMVRSQITATENIIQTISERIDAYREEIKVLQAMAGTQSGVFGKIFDFAVTNLPTEPTGLLDQLDEAKAKLEELKGEVASWDPDVTGFTPDATTSTGSKGKAKDPLEEQLKLFKEINETIEHNIFLREKQGASETELVALYKDYQDKIHEQANWFRDQGVAEDSQYIRELQQKWWELSDTITKLNQNAFDERLEISEDYIQDRNDLEDWGADNEIAAYQRVLDWMDEWYKQGLIDYEHYWEKRVEIVKKKALAEKKTWEDNLKAQIESMEKQQDVYEKLFSYMSDRIDEQIDLLEKQRDEEEKYWDDKIQALQDQNDELERQIELQQLQEALARAKDTNLLVFKDGQFQYEQDIDAISSAQADLDAYERDEALRQEVENLEQLKDQALSSIDEQIKGWEEYKEQWSSVVDKYQEEQDRLLLEQELGIELEGENWKLRLDNLTIYVEQYEALMQRIANAQAALNAGYGAAMGGGSSGGGGGSSGLGGAGGVSFGPGDSWSDKGSSIVNSGKDWSQVWHDADKAYQSGQISKAEADKIKDKAHKKKQEQMSGSGNKFNSASGKWEKYANGTLSAKGGFSLVGEEGAELRVINPGDGILPADATKNLLAMSKMDFKDVKKNGDTILNISNISLPNVKNGHDFIKEIKNIAYQRVYKRG